MLIGFDLDNTLFDYSDAVKIAGRDLLKIPTSQNLTKESLKLKVQKELGDEALANQYAGQNIQEKFAATLEKVKEIFVSLAEPLLPVLEIFTDIFKIVGPIVGLIGKMVHYLAIATKYVGIAVAGFYTLKFLGDSVYRTTVLTNAAKKIGLLTDKQAAIQLKIASMLGKDYIKDETKKNLVKEISLAFNDLVAERMDSYYLDFWAAFTIPAGKQNGYDNMIGNVAELINPLSVVPLAAARTLPAYILNVPLPVPVLILTVYPRVRDGSLKILAIAFLIIFGFVYGPKK